MSDSAAGRRPTEEEVAGRYARLAVELAGFPGMVARIRAEHVRDEQGFCASRECRRPGCGTGYLVHPCPTRVLGDLAASARRRSGRP